MLDKNLISSLVRAALKEDIGLGDITSISTIKNDKEASFYVIAKQDMVLCGIDFFKEAFKQIDDSIKLTINFHEGDFIKDGDEIISGYGNAIAILTAERVALNFLQYLSGVATKTKKFVEIAKAKNIKILDTRKTLPLYRDTAKYAVRIGGGTNHRMRLDDGILIKDNHIKAAGSILNAVELARKNKGDDLLIEVECETLEEVQEAVAAKADVIMLDNMEKEQIKEAISLISGAAKIEVSGGINLDNLNDYLIAGVDYISVGALTHSVKACDISLEINLASN